MPSLSNVLLEMLTPGVAETPRALADRVKATFPSEFYNTPSARSGVELGRHKDLDLSLLRRVYTVITSKSGSRKFQIDRSVKPMRVSSLLPAKQMTITRFFSEVLELPLLNIRWSWGASSDSLNLVVLRTWTDQVTEVGGERFVKVFGPDWSNGFVAAANERAAQIAMIEKGYMGYAVMCNASIATDGSRRIESFDDTQLYRLEPCVPGPDGVTQFRLAASVAIEDFRLGDLKRYAEEANDKGEFDPNDDADARRRTIRAIASRRGQPEFRRKLLAAYGGACAITNCSIMDVLEAAHIKGYLGDHTNFVSNGLLLRADIHTLFDLHLLSIDPETMRVSLAERLLESEYADLAGLPVRIPKDVKLRPNQEALRTHHGSLLP